MELIPVTDRLIGSHQIPTANARELHAFLQVKSKFAEWINRRINEYKFIENQDFICLSEISETQRKDGQKGVAVSKDYFVSLTMAKELAMVERTDKGREARQYFIDCERQLYVRTVGVANSPNSQVFNSFNKINKNANWHLTQVINTLKTTVHNQQKAMDKIVSLHERSLELQALSLQILQTQQTKAPQAVRYRGATVDDIDSVHDLLEQGFSIRQVSDKLGISSYAVSRIKHHRYTHDEAGGRLSYY